MIPACPFDTMMGDHRDRLLSPGSYRLSLNKGALTLIAAKITDRPATGPCAVPLVEPHQGNPFMVRQPEPVPMCSVTTCFYSRHGVGSSKLS